MDLGKHGEWKVNSSYLVLGLALLVLGLLLIILSLDVTDLPLKIGLAAFAVPLIMIGIAAVILAFYLNMTSYYRKDGQCQLAPQKTYCGEKCTRCIFAQEYVRLINERGPPPQNGVQ